MKEIMCSGASQQDPYATFTIGSLFALILMSNHICITKAVGYNSKYTILLPAAFKDDQQNNITDLSLLYKNVPEDVFKQWIKYIDHEISLPFLHHDVEVSRHSGVHQYLHYSTKYYMNALFKLSFALIKHCPKEIFAVIKGHADQTHLTSPCESLLFKTHFKSKTTWSITVHRLFNINITIWHGYTKFSDHCEDSSIRLYEYHRADLTSLMEYFCGYVLYQSVYTEKSKGTILVIANSAHLTELIATYQVHLRGNAQKLKQDNFNTPIDWSITSQHDMYAIYIINGKVDYIWYYRAPLRNIYLSSREFDELDLCIEEFKCEAGCAHYVLYHGLIPYNLAKTSSVIAECESSSNGCSKQIVLLNVYMTLVLSTTIWSTGVTLYVGKCHNRKLSAYIPWQYDNDRIIAIGQRHTFTHSTHNAALYIQKVDTSDDHSVQLTISQFQYAGRNSHIKADMVKDIDISRKYGLHKRQLMDKGELFPIGNVCLI